MTVAKGKREQLASALVASRVLHLLRIVPKQNCLLVLNYHRIGDAAATPYDPSVFSTTGTGLADQLARITKYFTPVSLEDCLQLLHNDRRDQPAKPRVLITFDDGYLDNYEIAFPILKRAGIPAVFFLATGFIDSAALPWWDCIAYILRRTKEQTFTLTYPQSARFNLQEDGFDTTLQQVLALRKKSTVTDGERFLSDLEKACETERPSGSAERGFMDWQEARSMRNAGMALGAHTHSHPILSQLPIERQKQEILTSRDHIATETGCTPVAFAYPVGLRDSFTEQTKQELAKANFQAGFSFYGGINPHQPVDPFDIVRVAISSASADRLTTQLVMAQRLQRFWP